MLTLQFRIFLDCPALVKSALPDLIPNATYSNHKAISDNNNGNQCTCSKEDLKVILKCYISVIAFIELIHNVFHFTLAL